MSEEQRAQKVLRKAMEMERKYRTGPSSEDVWSQREVLLQGAFEGDLDAVEREEGRRWGDGKKGDGGSGELSERFGKM